VKRLGRKPITVETRPLGEKWFGFGAVEYRTMPPEQLLARRRGRGERGAPSSSVPPPEGGGGGADNSSDLSMSEVFLVQHAVKVST
jgi:hypothetical protein